MARGKLRIYLGAAPGVGKTYAMLSEAHRRVERGTDCVVAFVEHHDRPRTEVMLHGLEQVRRREIEYRSAVFTEMDVDAVLERAPAVALVDELAHTNVPGSRNAKRWQDVEELLQAGIDVVSTVNIQHLESLGDVVEAITGVRQRETVPDEVVRRADQLELVDMSPQALRRRMAHGNIYKPDRIDASLSNYFRPGNLTALRELALLWVADRVDEYLQQYRGEHNIRTTWQARERIVVGLTGGPEGRTLIRRASRMAAKGSGSEILAVYIARSDGLTSASPKELTVQRTLVEDLGGTFHHVIGDDIPSALLEFARGVNATQIVLGSSRRKAWQYIYGPGVGATVARESGPDLDVHIVTHEEVAKGRGLPIARGARLGRVRIIWGWLVGVGGPALLTLLLSGLGNGPGLANDVLLFLFMTVAAALLGGLLPALASAAAGSLLLNYWFTPPTHTLTVQDPENFVAIVIFFAVAVSVASVVDLAARRTHQAARLRAESEILSFLAGSVLRGETTLDALLDRVRETFGMESVTPLIREIDLDEVVPMALGGVPEDSVDLDIPETLPMVEVDPGLLERAVANIVENAVKYSRYAERVTVAASALGERVELRVADRGPGVPDDAKERIFEPFQRYGDAPRGAGVGLGLAVARGFVESMGGTLDAEDTPGGGLTMVLTLKAASGYVPVSPDLPARVTS
ncbi:ATP-binding protein [Streptomyces sp. NPDC059616]|uniref:ATP-binding protein n=1 Tax=Streptomyces sp. NPDC059616 TaxID=3346886 RepID=UPI0036B0BBCD